MGHSVGDFAGLSRFVMQIMGKKCSVLCGLVILLCEVRHIKGSGVSTKG